MNRRTLDSGAPSSGGHDDGGNCGDGGGGGGGGGSGGGDCSGVDLVALGNPHLSFSEVESLAAMVGGGGGAKHRDVRVIATLSRFVLEQAEAAGHALTLSEFGVEFINDTCWCMLGDVVPFPPIQSARTLITNSGKYAHYAPGLVNRSGFKVRYSGLAGCVAAARTGRAPPRPPFLAALRGCASVAGLGRALLRRGGSTGRI